MLLGSFKPLLFSGIMLLTACGSKVEYCACLEMEENGYSRVDPATIKECLNLFAEEYTEYNQETDVKERKELELKWKNRKKDCRTVANE